MCFLSHVSTSSSDQQKASHRDGNPLVFGRKPDSFYPPRLTFILCFHMFPHKWSGLGLIITDIWSTAVDHSTSREHRDNLKSNIVTYIVHICWDVSVVLITRSLDRHLYRLLPTENYSKPDCIWPTDRVYWKSFVWTMSDRIWHASNATEIRCIH